MDFNTKKVVQNINSHNTSMQQICKPLEKIGISGFFYARYYHDNTLANLNTHPDWSLLFFERLSTEQYAPEEIQTHLFNENNMNLWEKDQWNKVWQEGRAYFDIGNGVTLKEEHDNYVENFCFYSQATNHKINDLYINYPNLLWQFSKYFLEIANKLIQQANMNKLIIPEKYRVIKNNDKLKIADIEDFLSTIASKGINLGKKYDYQRLTKREIECLAWLFVGKSSEEIGQIIACSSRTVEVHLNKIKAKFNCHKLTTLIHHCSKLGIDRLFPFYIKDYHA